ncbi:MAG: signal peptidase II [Kiritimatiellia bacterium]
MRVALYAALIIFLDQATKFLAVAKLKNRHSIEIIPGFFNLSYVENAGAAWGIFSGHRYPLLIFALISLIYIILQRKKIFGHLKFSTVLPALICGGIAGNMIDRIRLSRVIDFLDFHAFGKHFPAFNIADSAICIGAFLFILAEFLYSRQHKKINADLHNTTDHHI